MSNNKKRGQQWQQNKKGQQNPIFDLIKEIEKVGTLKEVFTPENYALPDGWAYKTADTLRRNQNAMNSNQLRKIFTQLKTIEDSVDRNKGNELTNDQMNQILLLMPQIAYARGRNLIPKDFYDLMTECITPKRIKDKEDYKSFVGFYTAVIAYSKMGRR